MHLFVIILYKKHTQTKVINMCIYIYMYIYIYMFRYICIYIILKIMFERKYKYEDI